MCDQCEHSRTDHPNDGPCQYEYEVAGGYGRARYDPAVRGERCDCRGWIDPYVAPEDGDGTEAPEASPTVKYIIPGLVGAIFGAILPWFSLIDGGITGVIVGWLIYSRRARRAFVPDAKSWLVGLGIFIALLALFVGCVALFS